MSPERIKKLRELADRGIGGEKDNARNILTRLGLDWKKPKDPLMDRVKKVFGGDTKKIFECKIEYATDILLIHKLLEIISKDYTISMSGYSGISKVRFTCTQAESQDILAVFSKHRKQFNNSMYRESYKYISTYLNL